jgi:hypothetical protein
MSELRRWAEEGATAEEKHLLDASRLERPPAGARKRVLVALGAAGSVTSISTGAASATAGVALGVKVLGAALLVSSLAAGGLAVQKLRTRSIPAPVVATSV